MIFARFFAKHNVFHCLEQLKIRAFPYFELMGYTDSRFNENNEGKMCKTVPRYVDDPEIMLFIEHELLRQQETICLIASENYAPENIFKL